jgi:ceramide synthetase
MTQDNSKNGPAINNEESQSKIPVINIPHIIQNTTKSNNSDFQENEIKKISTKNSFSFKSNFIFTNVYMDTITYILILSVLYSSYFLFAELESHVANVKSFRPEYKFPEVKDMIPAFYIFIALMLIHQTFKYLTVDKLEKCLSTRYDKDEISIYKNKVSTNIIKFFLYSFSTILGYYALKDFNFFPKSLGGSGNIKNAYIPGYPDYLFFDKSEYFDHYYNFNLAFVLFDTYILVVYPFQSDFLLMVLHHLVTFNLVVFSFLVNFSHVGAVVYFIHYSGDVLSILVRICIHINIPEIISVYLTIVFLAIFVYTRLFVFGEVFYQTFNFQINKDYSVYSLYLNSFLGVLMILNIIWIVLISKKVINFLITGKVEEIYKFKKKQENKKKI